MVSIFMPYGHTVKILEELLHIHVSETLLMKITQKTGEHLYEEFLTKAISGKPQKKEVDKLYVQADGSMVPIGGTGKIEYRENKLGLVFSNKDIKEVKSANGKIHHEITNKKFVSSIGKGVQEFKTMLVKAAKLKGADHCKQLVFLTDGAVWLKNIKKKYFKNAIHILDWYHAVDHLWGTAHVLFGEENKEKCAAWVKPLKELLWEGKVNQVIELVTKQARSEGKNKSTSLFNLRTYYMNNKKSMQYDNFRECGLYIGSGPIESANKYIVANRLKLAGMRWSLKSANAIIWLRCKYFEDKWDAFWGKIHLPEILDPAS